MTPLPLRQSILETLAFFDVFDAPLTAEELHARLWRGGTAAFESTKRTLEQLCAEGIVTFERGYYGLRNVTDVRLARVALVEKKYVIAKQAVRRIRYVPFVLGVFVCNNLALETVSEESDVDIFIVTAVGRIWIARFFVTLALRLSRLARTKKKHIDRVCLSFYATTDALDMSTVTISEPDIYMAYWVQSLVPLYDPKNVLKDIYTQNTWLRPLLKLVVPKMSKRWSVKDNRISRIITRACEAMWKGQVGDLIDTQAKEFQKTKMKFRFDSVRDEPDSRVIVSDTMLKFHENDRRLQYKEAWEERVVNLSE
jgi:hypothetical protein